MSSKRIRQVNLRIEIMKTSALHPLLSGRFLYGIFTV